MDSPRHSDASTFVTLTGDDPQQRLLQEINIDESDMKETNADSSRTVSPINTTDSERTYTIISKGRIAISVLSFPKFVIPLFGVPDTLIPFFPIAFISLFLTMYPMVSLLSDNTVHSNKVKISDRVRDQFAHQRVAVLVEDPITGEERWMIEKRTKDSEAAVLDTRRISAGMDLWCGVVFIFAMFFAVYWGLDSPKTLAAMMTVMVVQLVTLVATGCTEYGILSKKSLNTDQFGNP